MSKKPKDIKLELPLPTTTQLTWEVHYGSLLFTLTPTNKSFCIWANSADFHNSTGNRLRVYDYSFGARNIKISIIQLQGNIILELTNQWQEQFYLITTPQQWAYYRTEPHFLTKTKPSIHNGRFNYTRGTYGKPDKKYL